MRILIANSVPLIRQKIREAFSEMGYYRFFEAGCGATALEKIENGIDILITDLRLDHVDGLEMIRIFKQTKPGVETQIIVISHDNSRSLMDELKALGVSYSIFLKKHADLRRLQEMLVREGRDALARTCFEFLPVRADLDLSGWADTDIFAHT